MLSLPRLLAAGLFTSQLMMVASSHAAPMALDDVFDLEYVSQTQISKDGKTVYFVRNYMDINADRQRSNLWAADTRSGEIAPLTTGLGNDRSPVLSPNGDRLAYIASGKDGSQIYVRWLDSGQTARLSQLDQGAGNLTWSPDGSQLFFTQFVKVPAKPAVSLPGKPEKADWAKPPVLVDQTYYRADGAGFLSPGYDQIFVMDANGGRARQLTHAKLDHNGPLSVSPDGKTLYFSATPAPETDVLNSEVYRLDLATGESQAITNRQGPDQHPRLSPDGKRIAYLGFDDQKRLYEVTRLTIKDLASGTVTTLTADLERDIGDYHWRDDGKGLYISYDDQGESVIAWQPLKGKRTQLTRELGGTSLGRPYASGHFSVRDDLVAFSHSDSQRPAELALLEGKKQRLLTQLNDDFLARVSTGKAESFTVKSSVDGLPIQGWIVYPPTFDASKKYPLMLEIHGGPVANYGPRFAAEMQLFAAAGYVVVYLNPRGSDSYGPEFVNQIHHNYPSHDYDDLMDGVDAVIARGFIDEKKLFVTGGSGGGVLTAWIVGHTDRFAAAVAAKPVINWFSFTLTADFYPYFTRYWFAKKPWEDIAHYMARSPISHVGKVKTPTMLLTGEADYRTPMSETEQYYQALKLAGVDTAMVRIPEAGHSIAARPSNLMNKVAYILWWFEQYGGPNFGSDKPDTETTAN